VEIGLGGQHGKLGLGASVETRMGASVETKHGV